MPSGVPEKQARRSAIVTHALRGAWGETLALERALQVGAARPHPSVRGPSGLPKRSPVAPGCRRGVAMTARPPCLPQPPRAALGSARPGSRVMGAGLRPSFPAERPRGASIYGRRVRANQTKTKHTLDEGKCGKLPC